MNRIVSRCRSFEPAPAGLPRTVIGLMIGAWLATITTVCPAGRTATARPFPFRICGDRFLCNGSPVFLRILGYQPREPGQEITGEIREARVLDDLRRFAAYGRGSDPVLLRVYPQPTAEFPHRVPKCLYDGARKLDLWIIRDIYFQSNYWEPDAIEKGRAAVDAVMAEVQAANGFDRIFAWEIANEFKADTAEQIEALEAFLIAMSEHIKARMAAPGLQCFSNWVTWAAWPPADPLRTDGNPIDVSCLDYYSFNAYSYDPERIRDHQAGPGTGTPFAGYVAALTSRLPDMPLVITETGLPDSPSAIGLHQASLHPWYPSYRRGGLSSEQVAEGLVDRYWDVRLSRAAGIAFFEWNDEWHKAGEPDVHNDDPEEYFGLMRFDGSPPSTEARYKLQQEAVRGLLTMRFPDGSLVVCVAAGQTSLPTTGSTMLRASVGCTDPPVRFRWEASRGRVVGDSDMVRFYAGGVCLGPANVTAIAIDSCGRANAGSVTINIEPSEPAASIDVLTLGAGSLEAGARASGRVAKVDLTQYKLVVYMETNALYVQPWLDMTSIWIRPDGYWWTPVDNQYDGGLVAWLVPISFEPNPSEPMGWSPPGAIAEARMTGANDSDNDLLPDAWEQLHFETLAYLRYDDPDADIANNLEELLAATDPNAFDNDGDADGLPDTWERRYFGTLACSDEADPDGDGLDNRAELDLGTHPGRTSVDRDQDGLPDAWECRQFDGLARDPDDRLYQDYTVLDAYELAVTRRQPRHCGAGAHVGSLMAMLVMLTAVSSRLASRRRRR